MSLPHELVLVPVPFSVLDNMTLFAGLIQFVLADAAWYRALTNESNTRDVMDVKETRFYWPPNASSDGTDSSVVG